jgi:hypothetical protein
LKRFSAVVDHLIGTAESPGNAGAFYLSGVCARSGGCLGLLRAIDDAAQAFG